MFPAILRDSDTTKKLLECISDFPSGRRSLARISRTCRALSEPAMNMLWRELDSFVPLLALFPSSLLKRSRRPGLGLARVPAADDWDKVLHYGNKVQRITYDETLNNVAPAIFPIFEEHRPRTFILPNLTTLTWKVETPAGLDRCLIFLSPTLQSLTLEMNGSRFPQLESFLSDMTTRCPQLTSFSFMSHTIPLRDSFTEVLAPLDDSLERLTLAAPGVLSPRIGSWVLSLPKLKSLQIDLYGRSANIVDIFFSSSSSRASTPSTDSGVFSGEDDLEIIKPGIKHFRLVRFEHLCHLSLTGEIAVITGFLRHLDGCGLIQLDLVVDDPPAQKGSWKKAWAVICDQFATTLQSLRINATASSRFSDLVQATSRGEPASHGIALSTLSPLPVLSRFEVDLPASTIITASDIEKVANTCPNLEILRLCPVSRFPHANSPPRISLESLAPLLSKCRRLHTLAIVVNAQGGSEETLESTETSESLLRLHVGHSWISDPLPVTILLSHLAPQLDTLRWFHEKNRPGVVEANAEAWREVSEALPHLRSVRMAERLTAKKRATPVIIPRVLVDRSVDATVRKASRGVTAMPRMANAIVQCRVPLINQGVLAKPRVSSAGVTARPRLVDAMVDVRPPHREQSIEARPTTIGASIDATVSTVSKCVDAVVFTDPPSTGGLLRIRPHIWILSAVFQLLSIARTIFVSYPLYIPSRILSLIMCKYHQYSKISKPKSDDGAGTGAEEVSMQTLSQDVYDINENILNDMDGEVDEVVAKPRSETEMIGRVAGQVKATRQYSSISFSFLSPPPPVHSTTPSGRASFYMSESKKQERDFTSEVDALIPEATELATAGRLQEALDKVLVLEKQTRNAADAASTTRLAKAAVEFCYNARDYVLLNSTILLLSKKHGQLKAAVQGIVEQTIGWVDNIKKSDGTERWLEIIETLRTVTEGKIFLETPRARVTLLLAHYHEELGGTPSGPKDSLMVASELLSDLQVETYSSMERREKTEFILEQMRLLVAVASQKDEQSGKDSLSGGEAEWVKVRVGGRKINEEFLKEKGNEDLKLKYYELMIQHALKHESFLDVTKYYYKVWETPSIKEDVNDKGKAALEHIVYYIVLAPHNNEQSDMIHHLFVDPALAKLELHYNLIKCFTTHELMRWPGIEVLYGPFLKTTPVFSQPKRWEDLHTRVIEHNIRVVAEYYTRVTITRLTSLLDLTAQQTEEILARLVVSGTIWARIDRPAGIINFRRTRTAEDVMNDWSSDMQKLLGLVEKTWMTMNAALAAVKA